MHKFRQIHSLTGLSPLVILGIFAILVPVFVLMTLDNIREQHGRIEEKLIGKGLFLIRSFEAGTRTGMITTRWGAARVQQLLAETAEQPGIDYMMITDYAGRILAHSDEKKVGTLYTDMPDIDFEPGRAPLFHREISSDGGPGYFQVYKVFTPARHRFRRHVPPRFHGGLPPADTTSCRDCPQIPGSPSVAPPPTAPEAGDADWFRSHFAWRGSPRGKLGPRQVIFAAINLDAVEKMRHQVVRHAIVMGCLFAALGGVGVVCVVALQGYRSARSSLTRVKAFSDKVIATMPAGLITVDAGLGITSCNGAARDMLYAGDPGTSDLKMVLPPEMGALVDPLTDTPGKVSGEIACTMPGHPSLLLDVTVSPLRSDAGEVTGYLFLFHDLTELKAMKKELETSRRLAAVGKLAAGVAHEIRNPLSSIKGFATCFLERYKTQQTDREMAETMIREVERLNRAVTQLLEFARPMAVAPQPVDIEAVVTHSLKLIERDLSRHAITVETHLNIPDEPVHTDPDRVNQILLNLYLNALQAMEPGDSLRVRVDPSRHGTGVVIAVTDTGKGIAEKDLDRIFDPYFTTRSDGTGLGLAMVHRTVEALGGEIRVESKLGEGSCFKISIPSLV